MDTELARYWTAIAKDALEREAEAETRGLVVRAGLAAVPYLLRLNAWEDAGQLLDRVLQRDDQRATVVAALPALEQIAKASVGTDGEFAAEGRMAFALGLIDAAAAQRLMQKVLTAALGHHDYQAASTVAGDLVWSCMRSGRLDEALRLAEDCIGYTRQANRGPWTQLGDEVQRLQVLAFMGRAEQVLAEMEGLRAQVATLPETGDKPETVKPWIIRERLLDVGRTAALQLNQWTRRWN